MPLQTLLQPHVKDLGEVQVRRTLPNLARKMVGPFIFWDHMGPAAFAPGQSLEVRPHPHIGLATVTYLFEGAILHRDSLGSVQPILPGDVNWMVAGRGIVHSERARPSDRAAGYRLHGIQSWLALPKTHEGMPPAFSHHPKASLPLVEAPGVLLRLIAGTAFGAQSPVPVPSPTLYLAAELGAGSSFELPPEHEERAVYVIEGAVTVDGTAVNQYQMAVLTPGTTATVHAPSPALLMILGGARTDGDRFIHWNFVASTRERIEEARGRWRRQEFGSIPDETGFIPLPG